MTFYIVVKAKRNGRLLGDKVVEFNKSTSQVEIDDEICEIKHGLAKQYRTKNPEFLVLYAATRPEVARVVSPRKWVVCDQRELYHSERTPRGTLTTGSG